MEQLKNIINDVRFISNITKTKNKSFTILLSVILSQLTAYTDIAIIAIFSALIADQFTNISIINLGIEFILNNQVIILIIVILKFIFQYFQNMILKNLELTINKNLKEYILKEIFDKRNYSVADSYFYINVLSTHISFFYSSFTQFLNSSLQILAYTSYLIFSDVRTVTTFGLGLLLLFYPTKKLVSKARKFMHESYETGQESNREVQRVVDNLFLIKILKKDNFELDKFSNTLQQYNFNSLNNFKFGVLNSFLPTFITLFVLTLLLGFTRFVENVSLDFIGVLLRLFQSLGVVTGSVNKIVNSHVHMEKFHEMQKNKLIQNYQNFELIKNDEIGTKNLYFKYFNSENYIFEDLSFKLNRNTHTILTGPNGSGKSTLLGLLSGVFYSEKGKVYTFSDKFGYIGPTPLIFQSTLYENLLYGNNRNIDEKQILDLMKELNLFKESHNYNLKKLIDNKSLSSGQMQKIAFIRALLSKPDILLLDEAVSNLDDSSKSTIFDLLKVQKVTIINSTHDPTSYKSVDMEINIEIIDEKRTLKINS